MGEYSLLISLGEKESEEQSSWFLRSSQDETLFSFPYAIVGAHLRLWADVRYKGPQEFFFLQTRKVVLLPPFS